MNGKASLHAALCAGMLAMLTACAGSSSPTSTTSTPSSAASVEPSATATTAGHFELHPIAGVQSDELATVSIPVPSGSTATGLPDGLAVSGDKIQGRISATATDVTKTRRAIGTKAFAVTVIAHDAGGRTGTTTFQLTVRDTHTTMPNYIGKYGCGGTGNCAETEPNVNALTTPAFSCYAGTAGQQPESSIWRQSIAPGTVIRWGAPATFWYFEPSGHGCQDVKKGW